MGFLGKVGVGFRATGGNLTCFRRVECRGFFMNVKRDIKFQSSGNCEDQGGSECDTVGEDEDCETQNGHQHQTSEYIRNCV